MRILELEINLVMYVWTVILTKKLQEIPRQTASNFVWKLAFLVDTSV